MKKKLSKEYQAKVRKEWYEQNKPSGEAFGYPDCCIKAFGHDAPELMTGNPTKIQRQRYYAGFSDGYMKGTFTGFIPCEHHAKEIIKGKIKLEDLIEDRLPNIAPFPLYI